MTPAQVIEDLPDPDEEDVRQVRRRAPSFLADASICHQV